MVARVTLHLCPQRCKLAETVTNSCCVDRRINAILLSTNFKLLLTSFDLTDCQTDAISYSLRCSIMDAAKVSRPVGNQALWTFQNRNLHLRSSDVQNRVPDAENQLKFTRLESRLMHLVTRISRQNTRWIIDEDVVTCVPLSERGAAFRRRAEQVIGRWQTGDVGHTAVVGVRAVAVDARVTPTGARLHAYIHPTYVLNVDFVRNFAFTAAPHCRDPIRLYRNVNIYITIYIQNYLFILHLIFH